MCIRDRTHCPQPACFRVFFVFFVAGGFRHLFLTFFVFLFGGGAFLVGIPPCRIWAYFWLFSPQPNSAFFWFVFLGFLLVLEQYWGKFALGASRSLFLRFWCRFSVSPRWCRWREHRDWRFWALDRRGSWRTTGAIHDLFLVRFRVDPFVSVRSGGGTTTITVAFAKFQLHRSGKVRSGQVVRSGHVRSGQVRSGRSGQVRAGQALSLIHI